MVSSVSYSAPPARPFPEPFLPSNPVELNALLIEALQGDEPHAQYVLGLFYSYANWAGPDWRGTLTESKRSAFEWFSRSAEQGHAGGQFRRALYLFHGMAVSPRRSEAVVLIQQAAEQGCARAQFTIGDFYANGIVVKRNFETAFEWYEEAARRDHPSAHARMGLLYANGTGTKLDIAKAFAHLIAAKKLGCPYAQNGLKNLLSRGQFVVDSEGTQKVVFPGNVVVRLAPATKQPEGPR